MQTQRQQFRLSSIKRRFFETLICSSLILILFVPGANAKAAFKSKSNMIKSADVIAYVHIEKVKKVSIKGKHWTFGQQAIVKPIQIFKGSLPPNPKIFGGENFICASVGFKPGKSLLFLQKVDNYYTGNNWHLSVRPSKGSKIEWFSSTKNRFKFTAIPKTAVFKDIESELKQMTNNQSSSYIDALAKAKLVTDDLIGEVATKSHDFERFQKALRDKSLSTAQLKQAMTKATPAGKIYLAMVTMKLHPQEGKTILKSMTNDNQNFEFQSGCEILNYTMKSAAAELLKSGKLLSIDPLKI